ncbi:type IV pilus assembly protein PilM [Armatimonas sp.]|uniref:type IV pilus assembly protein PilM n=1 Tax=Armatimonas sp. TaxID=1872638 RepID=UPI00286C2749|nr:type IV pilus assembly protein PilM [Armatimonas sp.]
MSILSSLFGKEVVVGLDIGSAMIKAVQLEPTRTGFRVVRAAEQKTPQGTVRDGVVISRESVATAVRQMLQAAGITANSAVLSVSGPSSTVRQIRVPKMNEATLTKSIRYEAGKYLSNNLDDSSLAFEILGPCDDDPAQMDVMLVGTSRDIVDSRVIVAQMAGLEAVAVDIESFALIRALVEISEDDFADTNLRAIVDMGAAHTEVIILSGPDFALTRSIPISGDTFSDALKNQLRIESSEAELRKLDIDMGALITGEAPADTIELARIIQTTVDELLREIRRSINYFQSQLAEEGVSASLSEILLVGGAAQMRNMSTYMSARLGIPTRLCDPFTNSRLETSPEAEEWLQEQGASLAGALGLALKESLAPQVGGKR